MVLMSAARAPSLAEHLAQARRMSPVYEGFRNARLRLRASPPSAERRRLDQLLLLNMERSRMLPPKGRYILVDAASAKLWLYENGRRARDDEGRGRQGFATLAADDRTHPIRRVRSLLEHAA
jgi:hypothetical protein